MKKTLLLFICLFSFNCLNAQCAGGGSLIENAGFEGAYTGTGGWATDYVSSVGSCVMGSDRFGLSTSLSTITPQSGSQFWGMQDIDGNCGSSAGETLTFTYTVPGAATYPSVEVCFWYTVIGYDTGDDIFATVDVAGCPEVDNMQIVDGLNSNIGGPITLPWTQQCFTVPVSAGDVVTLTILADQNGGSDYGGIDNVSICESSATPSTNCAGTPVTLTSFEAKVLESEKTVILDWVTASEENNEYFSIQRSKDGINFIELGKVGGFGTTSEVQTYNFTDRNAESGLQYYRLMQVDFDGAFEYSDVISVNLRGDDNTITISPNPSTNEITIRPESTFEKSIEFDIINMQGQVVLSNVIAKDQASVDVNISDFPVGIYYLRLFVNNEVMMQKIIKQ